MESSGAVVKKTPPNGMASARTSLGPLENTPASRGRRASDSRGNSVAGTVSADSFMTAAASPARGEPRSTPSSPRKANFKTGSLSPVPSQKEISAGSPRSSV